MIFRGGYVGRFSFEFNGIPGILIGIVVAFFSVVSSYGIILEIIASGNTITYFTIAATVLIVAVISWFLQFKLLR